MSNVLPPNAQKNLLRMYRARFIVVGSRMMIGAALICGLALLPSYFALRSSAYATSNGAISAQVAAEDKSTVARVGALKRVLENSLQTSSGAPAVIEGILAARPDGLTLEHIAYITESKKNDDDTIHRSYSVLLTGVAMHRELISTYRAALAKDAQYKNINVPVADLAGAADGHFSMTISGDI
jgi:hypothetical protein